MSDLEEGEKTRLQATLHMYLEEADAVKSVMNGESKGIDLQKDLEQKTDSIKAKEIKTEPFTLSEIGNGFLSAVISPGWRLLSSVGGDTKRISCIMRWR